MGHEKKPKNLYFNNRSGWHDCVQHALAKSNSTGFIAAW